MEEDIVVNKDTLIIVLVIICLSVVICGAILVFGNTQETYNSTTINNTNNTNINIVGNIENALSAIDKNTLGFSCINVISFPLFER